MSLLPSTLTGRVLDDGVTEPPVIELQGISAGQLSLVLTQYTPLETTTQNTADIGTNTAAIAALQGQVSALPTAPDLTPYALAADLAANIGVCHFLSFLSFLSFGLQNPKKGARSASRGLFFGTVIEIPPKILQKIPFWTQRTGMPRMTRMTSLRLARK